MFAYLYLYYNLCSGSVHDVRQYNYMSSKVCMHFRGSQASGFVRQHWPGASRDPRGRNLAVYSAYLDQELRAPRAGF